MQKAGGLLVLSPNLDYFSNALFLDLQRHLLAEGIQSRGSGLQYLLNLNFILASSLWQVAAVLCSLGVQMLDDLWAMGVLVHKAATVSWKWHQTGYVPWLVGSACSATWPAQKPQEAVSRLLGGYWGIRRLTAAHVWPPT